jgi:hypothetical protein
MRPSVNLNLMLRRAAFFLLIALSFSGCALLELPVAPGDVLFQDDFSRPSSGWDRTQDRAYHSDYTDGVYRIEIHQPATTAWSNPGLDFGDVQIEVDSVRSAGPDDNAFGVVCRYQDPANYYFFLISSDGFAGIGARRLGSTVLLTGDAMLPSEAILLGSAANHIRVDCVGTRLALLVNGAPVAEAEASDWARGDVGLIASSYAQAGAVIDFDNFTVVAPN